MNDLFLYIQNVVAAESGRDARDWDLVRQFVENRDQSAFAILLRRHGPMVLSVSRRHLWNKQEAEDVLQAAFLVFVRKAGSLQRSGSLKSWFFGVALRLSRRVNEKAKQLAKLEEKKSRMGSPQSGEDLTCREAGSILDEELNGLPEKYRAPLLLCCLEGKSRDEAAEELGWKVGAVKIRLERGRQLLRSRLSRRGVTFSLAMLTSLLHTGSSSAQLPVRLAMSLCAACEKYSAHPGSAPVSPAVLELAHWHLSTLAVAQVRLWALLACVCIGILGLGALGWGAWGTAEKESIAALVQKVHETTAPEPAEKSGWSRHCVFEGHQAPILSLAFAPNRPILASAGEDRTIRLWDLERQTMIKSLEWGRRAPVRSLRFSTDGNTLTAFEDRMLRFWDIKTLQNNGESHVDQLGTLASGEGNQPMFFGKASGRMGLYQLKPTTPLVLLPSSKDEVVLLAASATTRRLALARKGGAIRLWDGVGNREIATVGAAQGEITSLTFSPKGNWLASGGSDNSVKIWAAETGVENLNLVAHSQPVRALAFSPDGRFLATGGADRTVRIWDLATGQETDLLEMSAAISSLAFSPNGYDLAIGMETTVEWWRRDRK